MIGPNYLINLDSRPDRLASVTTEFKRVGLAFERFPAHTGEVPYLAFNSSQYHCLLHALAAGFKYFTIYEDDVRFGPYGHASDALCQLPADFGILQLGCNLVGSDIVDFKKPEKHSENLFRLYDCWQTTGICYSRACAQWIVDNWNRELIYDEWLRVNVYKQFKSFVIAPQVIYQAPGRSDIWGCETDYTSCFERGNNLLK